MSDVKSPKGKPNAPAPEKQASTNVVSMVSHKCAEEACKKNPERAGFCTEHFAWFKEGLITKGGERAKDFDKKYHAWLRRNSKAA